MQIYSSCYPFISKVKDIYNTFCPRTCKIDCLYCKYTKHSSRICFGLRTLLVNVDKVCGRHMTDDKRWITNDGGRRTTINSNRCSAMLRKEIVQNCTKHMILTLMGICQRKNKVLHRSFIAQHFVKVLVCFDDEFHIKS